MPVRVESPSLKFTYAFLSTATAELALEQLPAVADAAVIDGLAELILCEAPATLRIKGLHHLAVLADDDWQVVAPLALRDPQPSVRWAVLELLGRSSQSVVPYESHIAERLRIDPAWMNRRAALQLLPSGSRELLCAADDPYWRVRLALVERLTAVAETDREQYLALLSQRREESASPQRVEGVIGALEYLWFGRTESSVPFTPAADCPFWDWDDAVLARTLDEMSPAERRRQIASFPPLLTHTEPRVRTIAAEALRRYAGSKEIIAVADLLAEPRYGIEEQVRNLLARIDADRILALRNQIETTEASSAALTWGVSAFSGLVSEGDWPQKLRQHHVEVHQPPLPGYSSHQRANSLTTEQAVKLVETPDTESSWHVLAAAARIARVPLWKLAPETPIAFEHREERELAPPLTPVARATPDRRALGLPNILVSPLGLSGHYGLPVAGFERGVEAGINLLFWEPNYNTLTEFARRIFPSLRSDLHFMAGTFEAEPKRVRQDVERALRNLRLDVLSLFMVFWVRSRERIRDDLRELLDRLQAEGKIRKFGLSTHDRSFAADSIDEGWNPVMVRHSAVHFKAEEDVFPRAAAKGTGIITFSNTCYGRLIPVIEPVGLTAADCYRYSLAQEGVTTCLTAPSTLEQLEVNLAALRLPEIEPEQCRALRHLGRQLYEKETLLRQLIRNR
jgi:hypothetical protein